MRQSQKNNRTRSRGRKPSNPLSRSYDSNGPDVKIRGTASHVAEKYSSLARDALASGDIVMAENYYQHAEHYLRIIAAAQPANRDDSRNNNAPNNEQSNNNERRERKPRVTNGENVSEAPQPDVSAIANTASELDVAKVEEIPGEGDQPVVAPAPTSAPTSEASEEKTAPAAPRRRRRTTYRPRKRAAAGDAPKKEAAADPAPAAPEAPQPAAADE